MGQHNHGWYQRRARKRRIVMPKYVMKEVNEKTKDIRRELRIATENAAMHDHLKAYAAAERAQMLAFELKDMFALDIQWPSQSGMDDQALRDNGIRGKK